MYEDDFWYSVEYQTPLPKVGETVCCRAAAVCTLNHFHKPQPFEKQVSSHKQVLENSRQPFQLLLKK
jgi:hypothetical protein